MIQLIDKKLKCLDRVKYLLVGGEAFPKELLPILHKKVCRIYNMYGPTETTIWSTVGELTESKTVNVGVPILNTSIYIVDNKNCLCECEEEGEIYISGAGLSAGYSNNEEATKKAFVYLNVNGTKKRVYRTGDLGMIDINGVLHCYGRLDNQIKLNGNRIELDDIDQNILDTKMVHSTSTCFDKDNNRLMTFYINDSEVDNSKFIEKLREKIPETMIPKKYIRVKEYIYTVSGKIDAHAMIENANFEISLEKKQASDVNKNIFYEIIHRYVSVPFDDDSNLEDLIADSIVFVQLLVDVEEAFSFEFDAEALVENNYVHVIDLYNHIKNRITH